MLQTKVFGTKEPKLIKQSKQEPRKSREVVECILSSSRLSRFYNSLSSVEEICILQLSIKKFFLTSTFGGNVGRSHVKSQFFYHYSIVSEILN